MGASSPRSEVESATHGTWGKLEASDSDSGSVFQLFIVGSKQFFRSFDPFLLYLTFSILKIEILLDNLIRQGKEFESKRRRKQELELINTRPGREEAKHLLNARNPLKKNGNKDNGFLKEIDGVRKEKERLTAAKKKKEMSMEDCWLNGRFVSWRLTVNHSRL